MADEQLNVPANMVAGLLAPTMAELGAGGFDFVAYMQAENAKTPEQRKADARSYEAHRKAKYDANLIRWQRAVDTFEPGGVRTVLEMHSPSEYGSCEGHDDEPWPCAEFIALEADTL